MKFTSLPGIVSVSLFAVFASQLVSADAKPNVLKPRKASSILINPPGLPELPIAAQAKQAAAAVDLNLTNVQGDILVGMYKDKELFFFFGIPDNATFKSELASDIYPLITNTIQLLDNATQSTTAVNISFSHTGLSTLGIIDPLNDTLFSQGIHSLQGEARTGNQSGSEHFGWKDGISQPTVKGFPTTPIPGQLVLNVGHFLLGETRDGLIGVPPSLGQGRLIFSVQLKQLVPEFNKFLTDNPIRAIPSGPVGAGYGSELLGARMVGRWKSTKKGSLLPLDLAPFADDVDLGNDKSRNNVFSFAGEGNNETLCPFSARIRKTNPHDDLPSSVDNDHRIIRSAILYGPEVSEEESASNTTSSSIERGLAFVAYQSDLNKGFQFLQQTWANNPNFKEGGVGFDPIIGAKGGAPRNTSGLDPIDPSRNVILFTDFAVSRGGEYFFSPSLSAFLDTLAA